jgi:hypothetical protein
MGSWEADSWRGSDKCPCCQGREQTLLHVGQTSANGTSCARITLDVTVEPGTSSAIPVWGFVVVNPWPCAHEAEEDMPRRLNHNSHVPAPHHQIAGFRSRDLLKPLHPDVEIGGTRVGVSEASSCVDCMHEMRTVALTTCFRIERCSDYGQTVVWTQCAVVLPPVIPIPAPPGARSSGLSRPFLGPRNTQSKSTKQGCNRRSHPNPHRLILMPLSLVALLRMCRACHVLGRDG